VQDKRLNGEMLRSFWARPGKSALPRMLYVLLSDTSDHWRTRKRTFPITASNIPLCHEAAVEVAWSGRPCKYMYRRIGVLPGPTARYRTLVC